jgi:hypothetical protein
MDMKTYQTNKEKGDKTAPEFEREKDFFIPLGVFLLEIEECSDETDGTEVTTTDYRKEMRN